MRSAAGVFERPTLLVRPMSTSTFVFWFSSHKVYQPVCLQTRSNILLYIPVCLLIGRDYDANGAWYLHERWDWQAPPSYRGRLRRDVEFGLHRRESWHARGRYPDAHGLEVPARRGAASGRHSPAPTAMAWGEGDSRAGCCGVTRTGRIPDGCGGGSGVRRHRGHHGPHRRPPTPLGRGPSWSRIGRARRQAAVGRTGRWPRRGRFGGWRRRTGGCRGAVVGLRHALCGDGWPGGGHAGGAKGESTKERSRGAYYGRGTWDPVRRQRPVVRCAGAVLGWAGAGRRVALLGCCRLVRRFLHVRGLRLLLAEPEVEQRGQGEQPHLPNTPNHHGLGLPNVRRARGSSRCCGARDLLWRRPVGERLARGYQNVLMSPILVKERGRPSDCSAGCPALVGWLD